MKQPIDLSTAEQDRRQFEHHQLTGDPVLDAATKASRVRAKIQEEMDRNGTMPEGYEWDLAYRGPGRRLMKCVYDEHGDVIDRIEVGKDIRWYD